MCSLNIFENVKGVLYYEKIDGSNTMVEVARRVSRRFKKQDKLTKKNDRDLEKMKQLSDLLDNL